MKKELNYLIVVGLLFLALCAMILSGIIFWKSGTLPEGILAIPTGVAIGLLGYMRGDTSGSK